MEIDEHHQVLTCELTTPEVGDTAAVPDLLGEITTPFATFRGNGAYDGDPVAQAVSAKQSDAQVLIPPHKSAVLSSAGTAWRDHHIETIALKRRATWLGIRGYNFRSYVELAMQRYKRIFGNTIQARSLARQKTDAWISAPTLKRMSSFGMPVSINSTTPQSIKTVNDSSSRPSKLYRHFNREKSWDARTRYETKKSKMPL